MVRDQTLDGENQETLLFAIQHRLETGARPVLRPSEAADLLDLALNTPDPARQSELFQLFRRLGGMQMVRAALSDFD